MIYYYYHYYYYYYYYYYHHQYYYNIKDCPFLLHLRYVSPSTDSLRVPVGGSNH
jgi:hypothetical protein